MSQLVAQPRSSWAPAVLAGSLWYSNCRPWTGCSNQTTPTSPRGTSDPSSSQMWITEPVERPTEPLWANQSSAEMAVAPIASVDE